MAEPTLMRPIERAPGAWLEPQTVLEIGEIPVEILTWQCCGVQRWAGRFPDGSGCCPDDHDTRNEAVLCSKLRVAEGFVVQPATEVAAGD